MKKLLAVIFAFGFLFVGFQARASAPDLIVSDFTWSPEVPYMSDNPVDHLGMNVTIKNIGNASITLPENMYVTIYKGSVGVGGFALGTAVYVLNPGDSKEFDFRTAQSPNVLEQAGTFDLTAKVDGNSPTYSINSIENGLVNESNENNNTLTKKITIKSSSSDLNTCAISSFTVSPREIVSGNPVTISWEVTDGCLSTAVSSNNLDTYIGPVSQSGSRVVYPKVDTLYNMITNGSLNQPVRSEDINVKVTSAGSTTPSITVLTPNGRDMYEVGQQINVTWNSTGISASSNNIDITLHGYNANGVIVWSKELSSFTYNDGQEKVVLPTNLGGVPYGKNFVISVGTDSTNNPSSIFDFSDTTFTIGKATDVTNGGCSNGEVYSSTSGQACPKILDVNDGCYGARYSATTGKACPLSMVTEEGCKNGAIYSYTTGAKCSIINTPICPANMPNPGSLCSDGKIEAATKDVNNCTTSYRCIIPQNDLGCKNHEIYSTVTRQLCPTITIDSGCTSTSKYSSTTGQVCSGKVPEVDGGCNGINKYSLMTGKLCSNFTGVYTPVIPNTIDIPITRTLKLGIKGDDVKALQAFLNLLADGSFGPKTQAKVMEWQAAHGLTPDGSFGSMSRQKAGLNQ